MGRRAAAWVRRHRDIWDMSHRMAQTMQRHLLDSEQLLAASCTGSPRTTVRDQDPAHHAAH
jgi:hypothetical protein